MPPEKRITERKRRRLTVRFGANSPERTGFTRNISATGIFIQTNLPLPPGTILHVEIAFPERTFALRGRVVWAKKVPAQLAHVIECGMGIRYVQPPAEYRDYFERWLKPH
jgi:hypothetical protein